MRPLVPNPTLARGFLYVIFALALTSAGVALTPTRAAQATADQTPVRPADAGLDAIDSLETALVHAAPDLDPGVLDLALESQANAIRDGLVPDPSTLTVIDYSRPSNEPRLFVFDLDAKRLVFEEFVAHGRNSGDERATRFSNADASHMTSLGLFVTQDTYIGEHGTSLRLEGLEPGFNDRARARAIVVHGAAYVSAVRAAREGRIGRSLGCPALPVASARRVIARIRGGSAVFAYFPDERWLAQSRFIGNAAAVAGPPVSASEPNFAI